MSVSDLSVDFDDMLLRGWKRAGVVVTARRSPTPADAELVSAGFMAHAHPHMYATKDVAVCAAGKRHSPPHEGCDCGFYALRDRTAIVAHGFAGATARPQVTVSAVCEVALFGEVLEGSRGFRASAQQVLSVGLDPDCFRCKGPGETTVLAARIMSAPDGDVWGLTVVCRGCVRSDDRVVELSELTALLGCEVSIRPASDSARQRRRYDPNAPLDRRRAAAGLISSALFLAMVASQSLDGPSPAIVALVALLAVAGVFLFSPISNVTAHQIARPAGVLSIVAVLVAFGLPAAQSPSPADRVRAALDDGFTGAALEGVVDVWDEALANEPLISDDPALYGRLLEAADGAIEGISVTEGPSASVSEVGVLWLEPEGDLPSMRIRAVLSIFASDPEPGRECVHRFWAYPMAAPNALYSPAVDGMCDGTLVAGAADMSVGAWELGAATTTTSLPEAAD